MQKKGFSGFQIKKAENQDSVITKKVGQTRVAFEFRSEMKKMKDNINKMLW